MELLAYVGFGVAFVLLGLGVLWGLNKLLGWKLSFFTTHAANLQAWIYLLQTVILVGTLAYIAQQTTAVEETIKTNTFQMMVNENRELLGKILEQPKLFDALTGTDLPADKSSTVYLSMFFNHGFNAFKLREKGYIDNDWWAAIVRDMRDVMRGGAMQTWWKRVGPYYPSRYQDFVNGCILSDHCSLSDQKEKKPCGN
ncbi:MAG: hypothetical protein DMG88_09865 [Acidobacteria bacterium]|nr:MAG: hypothetical protein DMG88_09865 [Acidobacteriota bacterium]